MSDLKVLLIGSGAREHALAEKIANDGGKLFVIGNTLNVGIHRLVKSTGGMYFKGNITDPKAVKEIAERVKPDIVFIGPEEPLFKGIADALADYPVVGASKRASEIERSKVFARTLMKKYKIPGNLEFKFFESWSDAIEYIKESGSVAIKPARQAGGKGVKVISDMQVYLSEEKRKVKEEHLKRIEKEMAKYTDIKEKILIEEKVEGVEYTLQAFVDGKNVYPLPLVQDNPYLFIYDTGPETGGMGSIAGPSHTLPFVTDEEYEFTVEIIKRVIRALANEGIIYKGVLSAQMMLTTKGPVVIEFYSRLGDPEAVNVMNMLEDNIIEIGFKVVEGRLNNVIPKVRKVYNVVKAVAPMGYPERKDLAKGKKLVIDEKKCDDCKIYYGAVDGEELITTGSRAIEVYAEGNSHEEAAQRINMFIEKYVRFEDWKKVWRRDIGLGEYIRKREETASFVRSVYKG